MAAKQPVTSTAPPLSEYVADRALALHDAINAQTGQNCADINNCALLDTCKRALQAAEARGRSQIVEHCVLEGWIAQDVANENRRASSSDTGRAGSATSWSSRFSASATLAFGAFLARGRLRRIGAALHRSRSEGIAEWERRRQFRSHRPF